MVGKVVIAIIVIILLIVAYFGYMLYKTLKSAEILLFLSSNKFTKRNEIYSFEFKDGKMIITTYALNKDGLLDGTLVEKYDYKIEDNTISFTFHNVPFKLVRKENKLLFQTKWSEVAKIYKGDIPPKAGNDASKAKK